MKLTTNDAAGNIMNLVCDLNEPSSAVITVTSNAPQLLDIVVDNKGLPLSSSLLHLSHHLSEMKNMEKLCVISKMIH